MSDIGYGYGSRWHLCRYLAYHRAELNRSVESVTGGEALEWLDFPFDPASRFLDGEWKGLDFLGEDHPARNVWRSFWPQTGNVPNWDAVGRVRIAEAAEWLLVEAKAHVGELKSACGAKAAGGLATIQKAFVETKAAMGVPQAADWLGPYYQYANRLATLHFLIKQGVPARLFFVYFLGDAHPHSRWKCPTCAEEWEHSLRPMYDHLGLTHTSELEKRVHRLFLPVGGARQDL